MIDKIKVGVFCRPVSGKPWLSTLFSMPQYIADELGGSVGISLLTFLKRGR